MDIFVAGKWADRKIIHDTYIKTFKQHGFGISHDWTDVSVEDEKLFNNKTYLKSCSIVLLEGIKNADVMVIIMNDPTYEYKGTLVEMGLALALKIPIMVFKPFQNEHENIYLNHPLVKVYENMEVLFVDLKKTLEH